MTLQKSRPAGAADYWNDVESGDATRPRAAGTASCPEDCHYCSGPETD
jgi:hypothetical protein